MVIFYPIFIVCATDNMVEYIYIVKDGEIMNKATEIAGRNYSMPAIVTLPETGGKHPWVIMCHGTASDKNEVGNMYADLADSLAAKGIASVRFDFAGCGDSKVSTMEQSFMAEVADTVAVYDYICNMAETDISRIGIIGFSQGGRVMAQFLKDYGNRIKAAVSWSGACHNGMGVFEGWFTEFYPFALENGYADIPMGWREPLRLPLQWFEDIKNTNPMDALAAYSGRLLAVSGREDILVPAAHREEIAALNDGWVSVVYDEADHTFNVLSEDNSIALDCIEMTAEWFSENL